MVDELYVELERGEAVNAKKLLLSSEINALNLAKAVMNYKKYRKLELAKKALLRSKIMEAKSMLSGLLASMPEIHGRVSREDATPKLEEDEIRQNNNIERELREINERLARLQ